MTIEQLKSELAQLQETINQAQKAMIHKRHSFLLHHMAGGWQKFQFRSEYMGNHPEYCSDQEILYLFREGIVLTSWEGVKFSHVTRGQDESNERFEAFIESLVEGRDYLIVP